LNALRVPHAAALVHVVHGKDERREQIAQLAPLVLDMAGGEAQIAIDIRERAVRRLSETVASVAHAMLTRAQERAGYSSPPVVDLPIALLGGLFRDDFFRASAGYNIGERMIELKRDFLPLGAWKIVKPQFDAAVGAA